MNPTNALGRSSRTTPRVFGLLDHKGFGNLGDAAVFESFVANIKRRLRDATRFEREVLSVV